MFIAEEQCIAPVSVRCRLSATLIQRHHPLHLAHLHGSMPLCASVQCHPSATPTDGTLSTAPWSTALSRLDVLSDTTTRLSLSCCTASAVVTQTQTFTHSIFHLQAFWREAKLCLVTGNCTISDCRPDPPGRMGKISAFTVTVWAECEPAWSPLRGWLVE